MKRRVLILVRHGQYDMQEGSDLRLTELGRKQAELAGKSLARERVDGFFASTMVRAVETAEIVSNQIVREFEPSELLCEGFPSRAKGYPTDTIAEDKARFERAYEHFTRLSDEHRTDLLVCHGNIIRYFVCRALGIPITRWLRFATNHTGITRIVVRSDGASGAISYNETGHLPPGLIT